MSDLYLYDFGIFLTLEPDEEEKQVLENNIQMALQQKLISLDDAIDLREIQHTKTANQLIKVKKKKRALEEQKMAQENMEAQAQANAQAQQAAATAETQKKKDLVAADIELESAKTKLKAEYLKEEAALKKQLMDHEFELNMKMRKMEMEESRKVTEFTEGRKDERMVIQAQQQSELLDQKKTGKPPKKFESSRNDELGGGASLTIGGLTDN